MLTGALAVTAYAQITPTIDLPIWMLRTPMMYAVFKMIHLIGVVLLIGNVTVTAFWKVFADRTGDSRIIAYAQHLVTVTDWVFTLGGIILICVGGFGAAFIGGFSPFAAGWLIEGEIAFANSGVIWLVVLVPIQIELAREARSFADGGSVPDIYLRKTRRWLLWGILATIPLVAAIWVMVVKA